MGKITELGYAEGAAEGLWTKEQALEAHIRCNFYPPHPDYVVKSMKEGFQKYWNHEIDLKQLQKACYLRDQGGLYKYFESFLN
jgi:hypothetical protein